LGPGPRLIEKKNITGRGLTKVEKHWTRRIRENTGIGGDLKHRLGTFLLSVLHFRNDLGVDLTHVVYLRPIPKRS